MQVAQGDAVLAPIPTDGLVWPAIIAEHPEMKSWKDGDEVYCMFLNAPVKAWVPSSHVRPFDADEARAARFNQAGGSQFEIAVRRAVSRTALRAKFVPPGRKHTVMPVPAQPSKRRRTAEANERVNEEPYSNVVGLQVNATQAVVHLNASDGQPSASNGRAAFQNSTSYSLNGASSLRRASASNGPYPLLEDAVDNDNDSLLGTPNVQSNLDDQLELALPEDFDVPSIGIGMNNTSPVRAIPRLEPAATNENVEQDRVGRNTNQDSVFEQPAQPAVQSSLRADGDTKDGWLKAGMVALARFDGYPHWPCIVDYVLPPTKRGVRIPKDVGTVWAYFLNFYTAELVKTKDLIPYNAENVERVRRAAKRLSKRKLPDLPCLEGALDEGDDRIARAADFGPPPGAENDAPLKIGDVVLAYVDAYPPWPAKISICSGGEEKQVRGEWKIFANSEVKHFCRFFDGQDNWVPRSCMWRYSKQRADRIPVRKSNKLYKEFRRACALADAKSNIKPGIVTL